MGAAFESGNQSLNYDDTNRSQSLSRGVVTGESHAAKQRVVALAKVKGFEL
jgi:hypothetical protein